MWPYWLMYSVPAVAATVSPQEGKPSENRRWTIAWSSVLTLATLAIGFRVEVGGDWLNYLDHYANLRGASLETVFAMSDPGYKLANWASGELRWEIFGVNLLCGLLLTTGLTQFCLSLPRPWLALAVSVPYLIIVVGMGYSRQGVALGLAMLGLTALMQRKTLSFALWVLLGATFHRTAVVLLPISALAGSRNRYWTAIWIGAVTAWAYFLFLDDSVDALYHGYIEAQYQSEGAAVRLMMNTVPALLLLGFWKRFSLPEGQASLWRWLAVISIALLCVLIISPSSTAVDRIALYMLPLQLVVFANLPEVLGSPGKRNQVWVLAILVYYGAVLFVWLNYASHSYAWLPYRSYLWEAW